MAVQLVIKAPNQNIEDHIVHCNLNWTVERLKQHLHRSYPNKPTVQDQKLIYSGHLLHDHLHLKDILRMEDDHSPVHILHLVCKGQASFSQQRHSQATHSMSTSQPQPQPRAGEETSSDLRHRNTSLNSGFYAQFPQQVEGQSSTNPIVNDPQVFAQMAAMQQIYSYYYAQYMQSINSMTGSSSNPTLPSIANLQPSPSPPDPAPRQRENLRPNAPPPEETEEHAQRNWIDNLFLFCRFLAFFCIVFFYSTPERLMIVIVCAVIAFLYHEGWFVRRGNHAAIADVLPENRYNPDIVPNNGNNQHSANVEPSDSEDYENGHELEATMDADDPPHAQNAAHSRNNNQILSPFTFLSSFFSSLIPEPPPPININ